MQALRSIDEARSSKIKEVDFASTSTDASTEVTPAASDSSSGVTLEQVQKLLAECDIHWVNWLSSKDREVLRVLKS